MEIDRKPFQGVLNIIRFNWHQYLLAFVLSILLIGMSTILPSPVQFLVQIIAGSILWFVLASVFVSYWVYDASDLYHLPWVGATKEKRVLNVSAGFDETSDILESNYPNMDLTRCDFYDASKHTEMSLQRARSIYLSSHKSDTVSTDRLPYETDSFDLVLVTFALHEIRDEVERIRFLKELGRVVKRSGRICITEHLRDFANFIAYSFGFMHFYSKRSWLRCFKQAELNLTNEIKTTAFVSTFIISRDGTSH